MESSNRAATTSHNANTGPKSHTIEPYTSQAGVAATESANVAATKAKNDGLR